MASKYVLNYFPLPGRAETARLMFHLAGVEFTDNHIPFAEWNGCKSDASKFPLGQMPTLEVDGTAICQSRAISRFIAEELNLYGTSNLERCLIDQVNETVMEIKENLYTIKFKDKTKNDEQKVVALKEYFASEDFKKLLNFLSSKLKGQFFLGDKASYADVGYFSAHEFLEHLGAPMDQYPKLQALKNAFVEIPTIKSYLETRKSGW